MYEFLEQLSVYARYENVPEYLMVIIVMLCVLLCIAVVTICLKESKAKKHIKEFSILDNAYQELSQEHDNLTIKFKEEEDRNLKAVNDIQNSKDTCTKAYAVLETALIELAPYIDKKDV